ncbi:hypothetical protein RB600_006485 [Gaeumannomyces tritici]
MACTPAQAAAQQRSSPQAPQIDGEQRLGKRNTQCVPDTDLKRQRTSHYTHPTESTIGEPDPISFWVEEGRWPEDLFRPEEVPIMQRLLARKKLPSNSATSETPSDQRPREEKSAPYRDPRYETLLATKGSFMDESPLGITQESESICTTLLESEVTIPNNTPFRDEVFKQTYMKVRGRNEARVLRDITPWIVPPAEVLATDGATQLECLIESVNEGWNSSIPFVKTRPQPDYSVGFKREAFTKDQLAKLSPFIGDFLFEDQSLFMATYSMYFPFLTCEVKCGAAGLDIANRQNAHSMTLAVRAVAELFRIVGREGEVHRRVLAFSVSHNHDSVLIYGHYPVIAGEKTEYYRYVIRNFCFTELGGKEKWAAYRFTKNVYDIWMPTHFKSICSAIDQLPSAIDQLPSAINQLPSAINQLPSAINQLPSEFV